MTKLKIRCRATNRYQQIWRIGFWLYKRLDSGEGEWEWVGKP